MTKHIDKENHLHLIEKEKDQSGLNSVVTNEIRRQPNCLTKEEVQEARCLRLREVRMWIILREMFTYLFFLWMIYSITYYNRNPNAFYQVKHLRELFLDLGDSQYDYTKVKRFFFCIEKLMINEF